MAMTTPLLVGRLVSEGQAVECIVIAGINVSDHVTLSGWEEDTGISPQITT